MPFKPITKQAEFITVRDLLARGKESLKLQVVAGEKGMGHRIKDKSINRPALALTGYFKNFGVRRIQLFGAGEMAYLRDASEERQYQILIDIAKKHIPCMVVSRHLTPMRAMIHVADEYDIPLLRSPLNTRDFLATCTLLLEEHFAPRTTLHGTHMDIRGIGTLLRGESGVGKSECALALIERGHSLVSDDIVHMRLIDEKEIHGSGPELNRGYMECRGLGIINVAELFGIRSVRREKRLDLVITFQEWEAGMEENRTGLEREYFEVLGIKIPHVILPLRPGRDMARLVEVACMIEALRQIGHDPAQEFNERLINVMAEKDPAE